MAVFTIKETDFPESLNSLPEDIHSPIPSFSDFMCKAISITSHQVTLKSFVGVTDSLTIDAVHSTSIKYTEVSHGKNTKNSKKFFIYRY